MTPGEQDRIASWRGGRYTLGMAAAAEKARRRWFRITPDRCVLALLVLEGFLLLSEWFRRFPFNQHKGWSVLICLAAVGAALVLMFLWFLAALVFRLRFQFGILSLLLLVVVVAVPCSWLATEMKAAKTQRKAAAEVAKFQGEVSYDYQVDPDGNRLPGVAPPGPLWLHKLLGNDMLVNVTGVDFLFADLNDAWLEHLEGLPHLQEVDLNFTTNVGNAGLQHLKGLTKLQVLRLTCTNVSDAGLQYLQGLTKLQVLDLTSAKVGDAGLRFLKGLTQLQELDLTGTKVSDAGLQYLKGWPRLQSLDLRDTEIDNAGLENLKGLTRLRELWLNGTKVSDAGLENLKGLTQLQVLNLLGTKVSDAGLEQTKALTQLRHLCLACTVVGDAGVKHSRV